MNAREREVMDALAQATREARCQFVDLLGADRPLPTIDRMDDALRRFDALLAESASGEGAEAFLAAEATLARAVSVMAAEYQRSGKDWPRAWMEKHVADRATLIAARRVLLDRAEAQEAHPQPAQGEHESPAALLPPIEHDEAYDRYYIPMPGGWEVQTKGKGSTFRIANSITGERFAIFEQPYLFEHIERMAREIHAASTAPAASESRGSVPDADALRAAFPLFDDNGLSETEHCCEWSMQQDRKRLHAMLAAAPTPPVVASGEPPDWAIAQAVRDEMATRVGDGTTYLPWLVGKARELARSAAAKGEG